MPVSAAIMVGARKLRSSAVGSLLEYYYPVVHRIAAGLCGETVSEEIADRVFARALPALSRWRDDSDADRWFYHFTVLESRRHDGCEIKPDPLLNGESVTPAFTAFVRALRSLPCQQREAILLNHGERLNPRFLAVAMDCSAQAAANHLRAATNEMSAIAGGDLISMLQLLAQNSADLPMLMRIDDLPARYRKHFLGA